MILKPSNYHVPEGSCCTRKVEVAGIFFRCELDPKDSRRRPTWAHPRRLRRPIIGLTAGMRAEYVPALIDRNLFLPCLFLAFCQRKDATQQYGGRTEESEGVRAELGDARVALSSF